MTCIIGLVSGKRVYIGGDSCGLDNKLNCVVRADEKVFRNGDMVFGYTDSFRMGQLLRYQLKIPKQKVKNDFEYLCTSFIDEVMDILRKNQYANLNSNTLTGGNFILSYKGKLYTVHDDFQVAMAADKFTSVGCGREYALGAMEVLYGRSSMSPQKKIFKCLKAAEKFSAGVIPPFHVVCLDDKSGCTTHYTED